MNADRLREAADRLDANAVIPAATGAQINTDTATAALLRAAAEEGDHDERISGFQLWPNTYDAALALADVILGDTDE